MADASLELRDRQTESTTLCHETEDIAVKLMDAKLINRTFYSDDREISSGRGGS